MTKQVLNIRSIETNRPKFTVLSKKKIIRRFNLKINNWQTSLIDCLKLID